MSNIVLCKTDEVKDEAPVAVTPEGFPALAVYVFEGEYYVTDNLCTHGMAMLTDGYQDGDEVECPFHGGAFSIKTGDPTSFPCQIPIKTYPVTVEDGNICIPAAE
ncbi:MAG: ethylbenzene dioxygenase ferredoxin subunit [Cycloclasticus pugetii]|jgi:ethylbenzene dioxygenase ferredoxin subunit|uniref:PAH dioxygenase component ferredoxin n=3 Tax=Cycloclasticus TaxID=34067 RepID=S5TIY0_9GAMM|nr:MULTISPECIES: non-heme iron oxygenase ferredoxin subunit [Cycloclasticus]MAL83480.1 non-heme iron oxygenase ferredoxin subunit [Idiomarina sp.]BAC81547.1 ferredoxin [Cycloclasticus sp. A5]ABF56513.1 PAH dioxygenase component ferredoxin [Cycloclasticus sp. P1]AFT68252.1 PAH dioxygenase component ferredoxin [Cycloclasticus sp. P1]AGS40842.1 PAH dioxygenase component ferredoxin [Cycloclasticus zancles 78-ME]|tara:strand:- start:403 stop:717 length:315 start_codon:yes stop_codon:yes gene_type:complete